MTSRAPGSVYEQRVDFEGIMRAQDRRHADTLKELRTVIFQMQNRTLRFVEEALIRNKSRAAIRSFKPSGQKYRAVLRKRMEAAARRGHLDVRKETGAKSLPFRGPDTNRARERADTLVDDHLGRLTQDLKRAWNGAMQAPLDADQLRYVTRKVFADFAGWKQPVP